MEGRDWIRHSHNLAGWKKVKTDLRRDQISPAAAMISGTSSSLPIAMM